MPNRDGAAADVESFDGNTEAILAIEHLHRKGFVQFPEPDVIDAEAETLEQLGNREHRADPHFIRFSASGGHADVASERLKARSEEHTSELQSLMRISYAVFCLKKKTNTKQEYQCKKHTYDKFNGTQTQ